MACGGGVLSPIAPATATAKRVSPISSKNSFRHILLRCSNQHESKGRSRLISSLAGAAWRWSCATQLTFLRSAFMLLVSAFDPILVLIAIVR